MNGENTNRWWEHYLVRYLMPSIAGMVIVIWLSSVADPTAKTMLQLPEDPSSVKSSSLILLFLYGNLFCYISSYPILVFHTTRVIDFDNKGWKKDSIIDGYWATIALGLFTLFPALCVTRDLPRIYVALLLAVVFSGIQLRRLYLSISQEVEVEFDNNPPEEPLVEKRSRIFAYAYYLSRKRGYRTEKTTDWRREIQDTYKHMREHGNTAFIFVLEIILAVLCFCILSTKTPLSERSIYICVLFVVWALPSVFVHLAGQHIERRFADCEKQLER